MIRTSETVRTALYEHFEQVAATPAASWGDKCRKAFALSALAVPLLWTDRYSVACAPPAPPETGTYDDDQFLPNHTAQALKAALNNRPTNPRYEARLRRARLKLGKDRKSLVIDDPWVRFCFKHPRFIKWTL